MSGKKMKKMKRKKKIKKECPNCGGSGRKWVTTGVVQGQNYGPHTEGHYETCSSCSGRGEI